MSGACTTTKNQSSRTSLKGSMTSQGVHMDAGHAYAAQIGTTHDDFRSEIGCTLVSVFKIPT